MVAGIGRYYEPSALIGGRLWWWPLSPRDPRPPFPRMLLAAAHDGKLAGGSEKVARCEDTMRFFDTHCHLNDDAYREDLEEVIGRARQQGVEYILVPGYDLPSSVQAVELAREYEGVYAAVGVHPHDAITYNPAVEKELLRLLADEKVVAVGEIGLDYYYNHSPRERQQEVFRRQLDLAGEADLPVIIHNREAHQDLFHLLQAAGKQYRGAPRLFRQHRVLPGFGPGVSYFHRGPGDLQERRNCRKWSRRCPLTACSWRRTPLPTPPPRGRREPAYLLHTAGRSQTQG